MKSIRPNALLALKPAVLWLLAGLGLTAIAFPLGMIHRWISLALFPYVWAICAAPDYLPAFFLKPLAAMLSALIPGRWNVNTMSLVLAGMVFGQFSLYALILYCFSRRAFVRALCAVTIVHLCFVGIAAKLCFTCGWPDNSKEGQHAREAGELYPRK